MHIVLRCGISREVFCVSLGICRDSGLLAAVLLDGTVCSRHAARRGGRRTSQTELVAEVRENVSTTPGREVFRFVPARLLEQGQVVYYTVRITNPDDRALA